MELELLRTLADNGKPLQLSVQKGEGTTNLIQRDDGPEIPYNGWYPIETLRHSLAHYPREVWINGERLETEPALMLAETTILQPSGRDMSGDMDQRIDLGQPQRTTTFNAHIGGVWCTVEMGKEMRNRTYFSVIPGKAQHHQLLATVRMKPHVNIRTDEIGMLSKTQNEWDLKTEPELQRRIEKRLEAMVQRTMKHPEMPEPYGERVYSCPMVGHTGSRQYIAEAPLAVLGTPVVIDQDNWNITNGEFISIVEALYNSDSEMVPVNEDPTWVGTTVIPGAEVETTLITGAEATAEPEETDRPKDITLRLKLEKEDDVTEIQVPAQLWIQGDPEDVPEVKVTPGNMTQTELRDILLRVSWNENEYGSAEQGEYERERMEEKLNNLAEYHLGNSRSAALKELQSAADRFEFWVPLPAESMSATSRDGRITVTLNPPEEKQA